MSTHVTCTIKIEERKYAGDSKDMEIFVVKEWAAGSMEFSRLPVDVIEEMVEVAVDKAHTAVVEKLKVIKGKQ